jgi:hypothetical protein
MSQEIEERVDVSRSLLRKVENRMVYSPYRTLTIWFASSNFLVITSGFEDLRAGYARKMSITMSLNLDIGKPVFRFLTLGGGLGKNLSHFSILSS